LKDDDGTSTATFQVRSELHYPVDLGKANALSPEPKKHLSHTAVSDRVLRLEFCGEEK
jgi:hypothetical protein